MRLIGKSFLRPQSLATYGARGLFCLGIGLGWAAMTVRHSMSLEEFRIVTRYSKAAGQSVVYGDDQRPEREHHTEIKYEDARLATVHVEEVLQRRDLGDQDWVDCQVFPRETMVISEELAAQHGGYIHHTNDTDQYYLGLQRNIFKTSSVNYLRSGWSDSVRANTARYLTGFKLSRMALVRKDQPLN
jgi:hypothetical protein